MNGQCSGVILAGGENTRYNGVDKAFVKVFGRRVIDRLMTLFQELFDEVIVVSNTPDAYLPWNCTIVSDLMDVRSSLTGIHTGLFFATHPFVFFAACDIPFLHKRVVERILEGIEPGLDMIIPETAAGLEPLCAVYSRKCLPQVEEHLYARKFKILRVFEKNRTKKIPQSVLQQIDPELHSFININSPEDLDRAQAAVSKSLKS